ncbi:MAG: thioredoxin domain-containing protein [Vicinamibacterales bacterium]
MRNVLVGVALIAMLACSTDAQQSGAAPGADDPAARIGDRTITTKELDERWKLESPVQHAQAMQSLYEGRRSALDALTAELLLDQAAKAKGVTRAEYESGELAARVRPVSDADIAEFYAENGNQMQGRALQEMSPLIREFLENRNRTTARAGLIADLKKAGPAVRVMLDVPRQQIDLSPDDPSQGRADAPVTVVEFSDFQCPFCQRVVPTLKQVREKYGDRVRIVWKDFPLVQIHPQAFKSAEAGNCAQEQGKFWEYHDRLFANQQALETTALKQYAADVGLDAAKFNACLDSSKYEERVRDALGVGGRLGVGATPTTYVNGRLVSGAQPYEAFAAVIDDELERSTRK